MILEDIWNFGGGGGWTAQSPLGTPLAPVPSLCIVQPNVNHKIQKYWVLHNSTFYVEFISPVTIKRTQAFMWSVQYFCPILTTFGFSRIISFFHISPASTKFHENPSSDSPRWYMRTDWRTWRRQQALLASMRTRLKLIATDIYIAQGNENLNNKNGRQKYSAFQSLILLRCMQVQHGFL